MNGILNGLMQSMGPQINQMGTQAAQMLNAIYQLLLSIANSEKTPDQYVTYSATQTNNNYYTPDAISIYGRRVDVFVFGANALLIGLSTDGKTFQGDIEVPAGVISIPFKVKQFRVKNAVAGSNARWQVVISN